MSSPPGPQGTVAPAQAAAPRRSSDAVVIASLKTNRAVLHILATGHGPRYRLAGSGEVLTATELAARHPELGDVVRSARARPYLDATLDARNESSRSHAWRPGAP